MAVSHGTRRRIPHAALVTAAVAIGIVLGFGIDVARTGGLDTWLAQRGLSPPYDARGRLVDVDGRAVYLDCRGAGSPTVILEAGFGVGAAGWGFVLDGVAEMTRVCAWDRPGIGRSEPRGLHSAADTARDLRLALAAAGEMGPFVVVGHSLGGVYGRIFAVTPAPGGSTAGADAVLAFVMIDTYDPDLSIDRDPTLPADVREIVRQSIADTGAMIQAAEQLDWAATMSELEATWPVLLPATLLKVDPYLRYTDPDPARREAQVDAWHRALAARFPNGQLEIVPDTGHLIHLERPSLVIERVREVVLSARALP